MYIVHNRLCSERFSTPGSPPGYPFLKQYFLIQFRSGSSGWRATLSTCHKLCKTNRIEVLTFCRQKLPSFTRREFQGCNEIPQNKTIQAWARGFRRQKAILEAILLEHLNILTLTKKSFRSIDQFLENSWFFKFWRSMLHIYWQTLVV